MSKESVEASPFAIQLEVEFLDRLSEPVRQGKAKSVSAIIRTALERFDLSKVVVVHSPHVMISVRLPVGMREQLQTAAKAKHTSVGQLVRSAVEAYLPQLESGDVDQLEMPIPHVEMPEQEPAAPVPAEPESAARPAAKKKKPTPKKPAAKSKPAKSAASKKSKPAPKPAAKRVAKKRAPKRSKR